MAASTLVGQNLGAAEPERARRSVWTNAKYNVLFLGPVGIAFAVAPHILISFSTNEPATALYGAECLRIVALSFVAFALGMVTVQAFNGAGDTTTPMLVNRTSFWLFKIPLAWFVAHVLGMGPRGAFLAITIAYAAQSLFATLLFRRGRWALRAKPSS